MPKHLAVLTALALSAATLAPVSAPAGESRNTSPYDRFEFDYTSKKPNSRTGFKYRVRLQQNGAEQPPVVRELRLTFHKGTRIDTAALPACAASQDSLMEEGGDACPPGSRVARGEADVYVGTATPIELTAAVFNTDEGVVVILTDANRNVIRTLSGKISRDRILVVPVPSVPLADGKEAALVRFELDIAKAGTNRRPWARTPKTCKRTDGWRVTYAPLFDEPIGRVKLFDVTPCRS